MISRQFQGRADELQHLGQLYESEKPELVVLYGRRRIGKSALIQAFIHKKRALYFEGVEKISTPKQIDHLTRSLEHYLGDPLLKNVRFDSWGDFFEYLTASVLPRLGRRPILCIDELQWVASGRSEFVSILKFYWDNHWKKLNLMLVLCGSIASFMVHQVIRSKALYGRTTSEMAIRALPPHEAKLLFRNKRSDFEILKYLLIFGGVPKYLEEIDLSQSFEKNLARLCFSSNSPLIGEVDKIFYSHFRSHQVYRRIVKLLSEHILSFEDIAKKIHMASGGGSTHYLELLEEAEFISKHLNAGSKKRPNRYQLTDEFLALYFKFIEPRLTLIKSSPIDGWPISKLGPAFKTWMGFAFERYIRKHAFVIAERLGFADEVVAAGPRISSEKEGFQIDLLFLRDSKIATVCEVKFYDKPIDLSIVSEFDKKLQKYSAPLGYTVERALIAPFGPSAELRRLDYFHHYVTLSTIFQNPKSKK